MSFRRRPESRPESSAQTPSPANPASGPPAQSGRWMWMSWCVLGNQCTSTRASPCSRGRHLELLALRPVRVAVVRRADEHRLLQPADRDAAGAVPTAHARSACDVRMDSQRRIVPSGSHSKLRSVASTPHSGQSGLAARMRASKSALGIPSMSAGAAVHRPASQLVSQPLSDAPCRSRKPPSTKASPCAMPG